MGQVIVYFGRGGAPSQAGGVAQVLNPYGVTEELESGSSAVASTITAKFNDVAAVTNNTNVLVWCEFGVDPEAAVGSGVHVLPGTTRDFGPIGEGHKVSVIEDA